MLYSFAIDIVCLCILNTKKAVIFGVLKGRGDDLSEGQNQNNCVY